ncbi:MAG: HAD family phosphatase [Waddliaceae bacterium]|jgi:beta-phosphoglucomutase|nr:HAD family phosphatase [Waddliaceae bacterium]MBT3579661.1 HAD family phosphatase [Waddliaceae bacterium]MBT4445246.1 HAD family phosphatase [Waddliaceae bacterium]MBT6928094.1 HAD family phosphatase [Waddliaceae bacterium]MBT7264655.1 HAD family phosphatase [Waddliaceae bacterium]
MDWIFRSQLILFDFDGLLVNTEDIHYNAYRLMLERRGFTLPWSFDEYCQAAHYDSTLLRDKIYETFPEIANEDWDIIYAEKRQAYVDLLEQKTVALMPGVETFLNIIAEKDIPRCVVTHSPDDHISRIRKTLPVLETISTWITREDYSEPKPSSECYLTAIERLAPDAKNIIGFEDSPRGLTALMGTPALPVLICKAEYPEIPDFIARGAKRYQTFEEILTE